MSWFCRESLEFGGALVDFHTKVASAKTTQFWWMKSSEVVSFSPLVFFGNWIFDLCIVVLLCWGFFLLC